MFVYAAGGYYFPGKDLSTLRGEMRGYLDRGYNVVKMKIGGAPISEDRMRIEAVLKEIGSEAQFAVDANGRFDLETAMAYAKMLCHIRCSGTSCSPSGGASEINDLRSDSGPPASFGIISGLPAEDFRSSSSRKHPRAGPETGSTRPRDDARPRARGGFQPRGRRSSETSRRESRLPHHAAEPLPPYQINIIGEICDI